MSPASAQDADICWCEARRLRTMLLVGSKNVSLGERYRERSSQGAEPPNGSASLPFHKFCFMEDTSHDMSYRH
jgi:hypothetical protein